MNKKGGFTLIELLAVIVILAIIALIAVPIILNIVNDAKESANLRSVENYVVAAKNAVLTYQMFHPNDEITKCIIQTTGDLKCNGNTIDIPVSVDGTKAVEGTLTFESGKVVAENIKLKNTAGTFKYTTGKGERTKEVYAWYKGMKHIGDTLTEYTTDASTLGKDIYLKHILDSEDKIISSFACANFNGTEERCLEGGSADTYGWVSSKTDSTGRVAKLYAIAQEGISEVYCFFNASTSSCDSISAILRADSHGGVDVSGEGGYCIVEYDGSSYCAG